MNESRSTPRFIVVKFQTRTQTLVYNLAYRQELDKGTGNRKDLGLLNSNTGVSDPMEHHVQKLERRWLPNANLSPSQTHQYVFEEHATHFGWVGSQMLASFELFLSKLQRKHPTEWRATRGEAAPGPRGHLAWCRTVRDVGRDRDSCSPHAGVHPPRWVRTPRNSTFRWTPASLPLCHGLFAMASLGCVPMSSPLFSPWPEFWASRGPVSHPALLFCFDPILRAGGPGKPETVFPCLCSSGTCSPESGHGPHLPPCPPPQPAAEVFRFHEIPQEAPVNSPRGWDCASAY